MAMEYPTLEEVKAANAFQLIRWSRFLPPTSDGGEAEVVNAINQRIEVQPADVLAAEMKLMGRKSPIEVRPDESVRENCNRVAIDAIYTARDSGLNMHDAGRAAADVVIAMLAEFYPAIEEMLA